MANTKVPGSRLPTPLRYFRDPPCRAKRGCRRPLMTSIGPDWVAKFARGFCLRNELVSATPANSPARKAHHWASCGSCPGQTWYWLAPVLGHSRRKGRPVCNRDGTSRRWLQRAGGPSGHRAKSVTAGGNEDQYDDGGPENAPDIDPDDVAAYQEELRRPLATLTLCAG